MSSKEKLIEKGKKIYQRFINNVGKKNYERLKKQKPEDYVFELGEKGLLDLIIESENKNTNLYRNQTIGNKYSTKELSNGRLALTRASVNNLDMPETVYHKNLISLPKSVARNTIGHELGHAYEIIDIKLLQIKLAELKKEPIKNKKAINKISNLIKKKQYKYYKKEEVKADRNIPKYLKQMGLKKKDRQAHYYTHKNVYPYQDGRYQSRFGNLKYLKDYIFGFSELYKPLIRRINYDA